MSTLDPRIDVLNQQTFVKVGARRIRRLCEFVLRGEGRPESGVTVCVTDNKRIRRIHRSYMKQDSATDVMSFAVRAGAGRPKDDVYLGDVVVSAEKAAKACVKYGVTRRNELERYVVHGLLHLLGYRDKTAREIKVMTQRQERHLLNFEATYQKEKD